MKVYAVGFLASAQTSEASQPKRDCGDIREACELWSMTCDDATKVVMLLVVKYAVTAAPHALNTQHVHSV